MASLVEVKQYFGFSSAGEFSAEWKHLTEDDKMEIRTLLDAELRPQ